MGNVGLWENIKDLPDGNPSEARIMQQPHNNQKLFKH